ncbi:MAG: glycosyltransferase family 2 protein [Candidatus Melainabacteria bacterium]|nr:glycosyltransferase family 2 protein [Candidatus Melainabacteria bacterium]
MTNPQLSVVIVAANEARTVADVLSAAKTLGCEIIFVDSGSKDNTVAIAQSFGAKVYHQEWLGYAAQKNFALDLASGEWALSLDADEVVTPLLVQEIEEALHSQRLNEYGGFRIPRILYIGHTAITHGGFYPDAQLRLFRKQKGRFKDRLVHEAVSVEGKVGMLTQPMKHLAYESLQEFDSAMERYARLSVKEFKRSGFKPWQASLINEILHPCWTFFYRYILRAGFLDGRIGLAVNLIYSNYVRCKIRYLRESLEHGN